MEKIRASRKNEGLQVISPLAPGFNSLPAHHKQARAEFTQLWTLKNSTWRHYALDNHPPLLHTFSHTRQEEQQTHLRCSSTIHFINLKKRKKIKHKLKHKKIFKEEQQHQNSKKTICCSFKQDFFFFPKILNMGYSRSAP